MRKYFIGLCFFAGAVVYGQQNFASISFGVSLPQGAFASTDDLATGGYAKEGGVIKFDAGYFPVSYFGIGASFAFSSNYGIREEIQRSMIDHIESNATNPTPIPPEANIVYGSGFWNNVSLFIGPHFSIRATQRLYFDIRALGGLSIVRPPDQELLVELNGENYHSYVENSRLAFCFTGGAGIRVKLNEDLALRFGADYIRTRSKFDYNFDLFAGLADDIPPIHSDFAVQTIELTLGLAYAF